MNFVLLLVYLCCETVICALISHRFSPFKQSAHFGTNAAGAPVFLTPYIDASDWSGAIHASRVKLGDIQSHAAYLTVNRTTKSHLYFWLVPCQDRERVSVPIVVWLQGGPGCSSLFGMFSENGPFKVTKAGLRKRVHAWNNDYHVLYIDQPVGTGFSFTESEDGYINTQEEVAEQLCEALVQFYKLFTKLKDNDVYVAGESYGGKYAPALAHKIHTVNRKTGAAQKIPLKGLMIGNGYSDPENMLEYGQYLHGLGLIDKDERIKLESEQEQIKYLIRSEKWMTALYRHDDLLEDMLKAMNFTQYYDYTRENFYGDETYVEFLTRDETRKEIHAGPGRYQVCSRHVNSRFEGDMLKTVRPWIEELLEHYPILFYNGQFDIICAHPLTENVLRNIRWSGASAYGSARRQTWRVGNKVAGYYKSAANLTHVLVRDASHMAPSDQPKSVLRLVNMFTRGRLR